MSFVLLLGMAASALAATHPGQVGVNIGSGAYPPGLYVDFQKENYRFTRRADGESITSADVDSEGWPTCDVEALYDYRPINEWDATNGMDDPEGYRWDLGGTWKCSFKGQATVSGWSSGSAGLTIQDVAYDPASNTTTFDVVMTSPTEPDDVDYGLFGIDFDDTKRTPESATNTGITDFVMLEPGYARGTTQTLTTAWLNCANSASFSAIRYHFTGVNNEKVTYPDTTTWAERKLTTHASQKDMTSTLPDIWQEGAWEYVIEIANATDTDPWVLLPVSATDNYVTQVATMLKNNLEPGLNVYVENSNEVWNGIFPQQAWSAAQASALGLTEAENFARRSVELCNLFAGVFGSAAINDRVQVMICWHAPWSSDVSHMLDWINTNYGPPSNYIYGIASQTYYSSDEMTGQRGGRSATVAEILDSCIPAIEGQLSSRQGWLGIAQGWGLPGGYNSYEGGPDCGGGNVANIGNRITAQRHFRMQEIYEYNYDEYFCGLGANIVMQFTLQGPTMRYGFWGLTDDVGKPDRNWKFKGARDILGDSTYKNGDWSPVANDDGYETNMNTTLSVSAPGVLVNDSDAENDVLTTSLVVDAGGNVKDVKHGTLTLNGDGSFTYTPDTGFVGIDTFEYDANDGTLASNDGTVTITVTSDCVPTDMHVDDIVCGKTNQGAGCYTGWADVTIKDDCGVAVEGATVTATFDWFSETVSGVTNTQGLVHLETSRCDHNLHGTWTIDNVTDTLPYDPSDNVVTDCTF